MRREADNPVGQQRRLDVSLLAVFLLLVWTPFLGRLAAGKSSLTSLLYYDIGFQWVPFQIFIQRAFEKGFFPLWVPHIFAGMPFAAFSHTSVFYPLRFLFHFSEYITAVNIFYPLHLTVAGAGVYVLCRSLNKVGAPASFFAAVSYTFTGWPFWGIHFLPSTCSNAWIPWFFWSCAAVVRRGRLRSFLLSAFFLGLQILGGDVETTFYALLFLLPFLFFSCPAQRRGASLFLVGAMCALGLLWSLIQLLPLYEYLHHCVRSVGVTSHLFEHGDFPLAGFALLFLPLELGGERGAKFFEVYLGLFTWAVAVLSLVKGRQPGRKGLFLLAVAALAFSGGSIPFFEELLRRVPLLGKMGAPVHLFVLGQLFLVLTAAQGFESLVANPEPGQLLRRAGFVLLGPAVFLLVLSSFTEVSRPGVTLAGAASIAFLLLAGPIKRQRHRPALLAAILILMNLADIYMRMIPGLPARVPEEFHYPAWLAKTAPMIRQTGSRYTMVSGLGVFDPDLRLHAGLALEMDDFDGWISIPPKRYAEVVSLVEPRSMRLVRGRLDVFGPCWYLREGKFIEAATMPRLDLLSLRFIISRRIPLRFSSPFFLALMSPSGKEGKDFSALQLPLSWQKELDPLSRPLTLAGRVGETLIYPLTPAEGDLLIFEPAVIFPGGKGRWPSEVEVEVKLSWGSTEESLYQWTFSDLADSSAEEKERSTGSGKKRIAGLRAELDLSRFTGQGTILSFTSHGRGKATGAVVLWEKLAVANGMRPFQLRAMPAPGILVYENREAFPRAFVVHSFEVMNDDRDILNSLAQAGRDDLQSRVSLKREPPKEWKGISSGSLARTRPEKVVLEKKESGAEIYQVETAMPGLLFISDQYYPGWRAFVRGKEAPILQADYNFRAIPVPEGVSAVRLAFVPVSFQIGLAMSLVTLAGMMAAGAAGLCHGRRRR